MNVKLPKCVLAVLIDVILVVFLVDASKVDYNNPVRSALEDEVKQLSGLDYPLGFKFYAGYLKASEDDQPEQWLYYWFVESETSPATDPIVLWLNGGPGASSLEGATEPKLGPFKLAGGRIVPGGEYCAWSKVSNMLFIEGPVGVGFSYSSHPISSISDDSAARANYLALKSFMQKFPQYAKNPLYLTGVSYAGVYLPTLGILVDQDPQFNLKGVAIGNGLFDHNLQLSSRIVFAHYHGLLASRDWKRISIECCNGEEPSRENCVFDQVHFYPECLALVNRIGDGLRYTFGSDEYDLYPPIDRPDTDISKGPLVANPSVPAHECALRSSMMCKNPSFDPPCNKWESFGLTKRWVDQQTREALHIPLELIPAGVIKYCPQYPYVPGGLGPQMKQLIKSERNLTMLVFNGDTDLVSDFIGSRWFVESLGRKALSELKRWTFHGDVAGLVQHFDGITFATIRAAGHFTERAKPCETSEMIKLFLKSDGSRNVNL